MAAYKHIKVRSPFYSQFASAENIVTLDLKVWAGDVVADKPTEITYSLEKEVSNGEATFEIAELIRDFISHNTQVESGHVWAEVTMSDGVAADDVVTYIASEGYGLYIEGVQHNGNVDKTDFVALPNDFVNTFKVLQGTYETSFQVLVQPQDDTNWFYHTFDASNNKSVASPILAPTNVTSETVFKTYASANKSISKYEFHFNGTIQTVEIEDVRCSKYDGALLYYINKEGFKTWLPFDLKHIENISVTSDGFRRNVMDFNTLDNSEGKHAFRKRLTGSKQSFTLNTDWMSEYYVKQIEELLISEYVWLRTSSINRDIPVNVKTKNIVKKSHVNDKLIQYSFDVESASEYLNTVR